MPIVSGVRTRGPDGAATVPPPVPPPLEPAGAVALPGTAAAGPAAPAPTPGLTAPAGASAPGALVGAATPPTGPGPASSPDPVACCCALSGTVVPQAATS